MQSRKNLRKNLRPAVPNVGSYARKFRQNAALSQRARGNGQNVRCAFSPPEDWHEPHERNDGQFQVIVQAPGEGYRHVVTEGEIRDRLARLPAHMLAALEVVQLSRITRKKQSFPCYGMQWGSTLYLYPIESSLTELYDRAPTPAQFNEFRMYGGVWQEVPPRSWQLTWSESAIKDFYLNNILIHELGHLLDHRNTSYTDRERYAEWFAVEHGFRPTIADRPARPVQRRHHSC